MSQQAAVVEDEGVILPPRKPQQIKFRWDPDLVEELKKLTERSGHAEKDVAERLMGWAVTDGNVDPPPVRQPPRQLNYEWSDEMVEKLKAIADKTNRSVNEVGEWYMRAAVRQAREELDQVGVGIPPQRRSRK